jgi:putative membrane protein
LTYYGHHSTFAVREATSPTSGPSIHCWPTRHTNEVHSMKTPTVFLVLAALAAAPAARAQTSAALDDPTIVAIFDAANSWDVQTSQVALKKSRNREVRQFAAMMVRDHQAVRKLGRDLAHKLHVTPTPPGKDFALSRDHESAMRTLRSTKGRAFDRAYIDHEVSYHQAVIDAVSGQLLPATKNAELKALEEQVAPNFQAHLAAAKEVQRKLEK